MDHFFEFRRNVRIHPHRGHWRTLQNGIENQRRSIAPEWQRSCAHLVENRPKREQIGAGIQFLPLDLLRRHIGDRAKCRTGTGKVLLRADGRVADGNGFRFQGHFCQPKVQNLRLTSVRDEDVRWFDVPVDDSFRMCGIESIGDLDAQIEHHFDFQRFAIDLMP